MVMLMKFEPITIPEYNLDYPSLWVSKCKRFRLIRCKDDHQWIVQKFLTPKYRSVSYHRDWDAMIKRWKELDLPKADDS